jgi:hypothetical protein
MDLAVYINELLGLEGEVTIPGIGYFTQVRVNGYYDEKENKFYPPTHRISFEPVTSDNEALAKFISGKKNISLASAKYFIEKYVNGLKQQLTTQKVEIAGLGYIYTNGAVLAFSSENLSTGSGDPTFFGLKPVDLDQKEQKPVVNYIPPPPVVPKEEPIVETPPVAEPASTELVNDGIPPPPQPPVVPPPVSTVIEETEVADEPEYDYEEPVQRNRSNLWIILLLLVIIVLLAVLGLYKYKPEWINQFKAKQQSFVAAKPDTVANAEEDTSKTVVKLDSTSNVAKVTPVDSTSSRFELMAGSFKTQKAADQEIKNFKSLGIDAKVVTDAPGTRIQISVGTFKTRPEAVAARLELIKTKKVSKDIYPLEITPK